MPEEKICPLRFIPPYATETKCLKSKCELWSTVHSMCSFTVCMLSIATISDTQKDILSELKEQRLK